MRAKSNRPAMQPRKFILRDEKVRDSLLALVRNLPIDPLRPVEVVAREEVKARKPDQNAALWAGPLRDISEQAWLDGRQYSPEVWAQYFKRQLLPESFDPELTMENYAKWAIDPAGDRVLIGSTTQLTIKGHAQYREAIEAFGASLGVRFGARGDM